MKLTVTCMVSSVNSTLLGAEEAITKDIVVANPKATVQNLRATVAIQFRLNVVAFSFRFSHHDGQPSAEAGEITAISTGTSSSVGTTAAVDLGDEKKLLVDCGLQEGDHLTVVPKNHSSAQVTAAVDASRATGVAGQEGGTEMATKRTRTEATSSTAEHEDGEHGEEDEESSLIGEEEEDDEEDDAEAAAQDDLFEALREVVPDLIVLRNEFLADPKAVMERIERNHPSLFEVITQNQETFITLMNNAELTRAAQSMLHGGSALGADNGDDEEHSLEWSMGEEEEELDEETEAQMHALFQNYLANGGGGGDFNAADLAALEQSGMEVGDVDEDTGSADADNATGSGKLSDKAFILARVPSEEDEKKIQALTELGFSYEQCKLAFYMCHRSIDRASNLLFESPPEV